MNYCEVQLTNREIKQRLIGGKGTKEGAKKGWETRRKKGKQQTKIPSRAEQKKQKKQPHPSPTIPIPKTNYLTPQVNIYTENVRVSDQPIKSVRSKLPPSFERVIREQAQDKQNEFQPIHSQIDDFLERNLEQEVLERERRFWEEEDRKAGEYIETGLGLARGSLGLTGGCQTRGFPQAFGTAYGKCRYNRREKEVNDYNRLMNVRNQYGFTKA